MGASKRVLAILLGGVVIAMISGCAADEPVSDEPQFAAGQAISIVVDSLIQRGSEEGMYCVQFPFSSEYIGDGVWKVSSSLYAHRGDGGTWYVYESSLTTTPDSKALDNCY